ncbi:MAG TPA: MBL fold metallo-hydrolase [Spirochaetota bacterium]
MDKNIFYSALLLILIPFLISRCSSVSNRTLSDHYDGSSFFNKGESGDHSTSDMIKWMWEMETVEWPDHVDDVRQPPPPQKVGDGHIRVTYINHATMLIQLDNINILTDPIWSQRAGPFSWMGPKRVHDPGVRMEDLPKIDVVLISHDHYDHLDLPTLETICTRDHPVVIAGLGMSKVANTSTLVERDWWQDFTLPQSSVRLTFVPARHNSGRSLFGKDETLWGGFIIEGKGGTVYFAGDTAYGNFLTDIKEHFPSIQIALFPIGSYEKRWFMKNQHMNPEDAVTAHLLLGAKVSIGMHYATFLEHPEQTIDAHEKDLCEALAEHKLDAKQFLVLAFGEGFDYLP